MQRFLIKLLLLTAACIAIYYSALSLLPSEWVYENFYWLPCFIAAVTLFLHAGLMKRVHDSKNFIRYYMGATGAKLFIYLITILIFAFINKTEAIAFSLAFFFFYLCFTIFEVSEAMQHFGTNKKQPEVADSTTPKSAE